MMPDSDDEMPNEGLISTPIPKGNIRFGSYFKPGLTAGEHTITATVTVNNKEFKNAPQTIKIESSQHSILAEDIHAYYPPPNTIGHYEVHLPHIVFNQRALPWERTILSDEEKEEEEVKYPWFTVLLLKEEELNIPSGTKQENITKTKAIIEENKDGKQKSFIHLHTTTYGEIMPYKQELPYLVHTRKVHLDSKDKTGLYEDGWFSVAIGNRFPEAKVIDVKEKIEAPQQYHVHCVSLEDATISEDEHGFNAIKEDNIKLISLASWSFQCAPEKKESFSHLMKEMIFQNPNDRNSVPVAPEVLLFRLQPDAQMLDEQLKVKLEDGYSPLFYHPRTGEHTMAWYRGPFVPKKSAPMSITRAPEKLINISFPTAASDLMIVDTQTGTFDQSYAAAFELGRALALADQDFIRTLMQVREELHRQFENDNNKELLAENKKQLFVELEALIDYSSKPATDRIPSPIQTTAPKSRFERLTEKLASYKPELLANTQPDKKNGINIQAIVSWIQKIRFLETIPFQYLVPHPQMLKEESIRFFHIDKNWLDQLTYGAIKLAIHCSRDETIINGLITSLFNGIKQGNKDPVFGLLLHSKVVSGWPGLTVHGEDSKGENICNPIRMQRLSDKILLCLFETIPEKLVIAEPHEQLSFGLIGDKFEEGTIQLRRSNGVNIEQILAEELQKTYFRNNSRVLFFSSKDKTGLSARMNANNSAGGTVKISV